VDALADAAGGRSDVWMRIGSSRVLCGVAVAVLVLCAAACGGGAGGSTTTATAGGSSAEQWATGVCSSFTTWKKSLESIQTDVTSQPSTSQLQKAGRQVESATETLVQSLKQLGTPETAQGEAAKKNLDTLATSLETGLNKIKQTLSTPTSGAAGALSQISTLSATLSGMANDLKLAGGNLKSFAPSDELKQGFQQSSACKPYMH
jgi:hypothetical protein